MGKVVAEKFKAQGHEVRPISRSLGLSFDDDAALRQAFYGSAGAFLVIPFDMKAPDLHKWEDEIGMKLAEAVKAARLERVVLFTGVSAHLKSGSSLGAAMMEERLDDLDLAELVHVRGAFIMENFVKGLSFEAQAKGGVYSTAFKPDVATPMIASKDIGEIAFWEDLPADELQKAESEFSESVPLKRLATVEEVASTYVHFMNNGFITGQVLSVDGGVMLRK
ncbi:MAG TPA: SDR family oxidoreductase [Blastocatellia bacterium]|nr:SDR family oxidoreductase [Blastocatellia bacterium]